MTKKTNLIQIPTDDEMKSELISASKKIGLSLASFFRMCAIKEALLINGNIKND